MRNQWRIASRGMSAGILVEYRESRWEALRHTDKLFDLGATEVTLTPPEASVVSLPSDGESSPSPVPESLDFAFLSRSGSETTTEKL